VHLVGVAEECAKWAPINFHKMREFSNKTGMHQIEFAAAFSCLINVNFHQASHINFPLREIHNYTELTNHLRGNLSKIFHDRNLYFLYLQEKSYNVVWYYSIRL